MQSIASNTVQQTQLTNTFNKCQKNLSRHAAGEPAYMTGDYSLCGNTRSHSEHDRETHRRRWYYVLRYGRVCCRQSCKPVFLFSLFRSACLLVLSCAAHVLSCTLTLLGQNQLRIWLELMKICHPRLERGSRA